VRPLDGCPREQNLVHHSESGWLARPSPWGTLTSYPLPAFLAHSQMGQDRPIQHVRAMSAMQISTGKRTCRDGRKVPITTNALQQDRRKKKDRQLRWSCQYYDGDSCFDQATASAAAFSFLREPSREPCVRAWLRLCESELLCDYGVEHPRRKKSGQSPVLETLLNDCVACLRFCRAECHMDGFAQTLRR
jgi:hypothetical protein